jgi:hypothetical protein
MEFFLLAELAELEDLESHSNIAEFMSSLFLPKLKKHKELLPMFLGGSGKMG